MSPKNGFFANSQANQVRFDGILNQQRSLIITSSVTQLRCLQDTELDSFLEKIKDGLGGEIIDTELEQFVKILPTSDEMDMFQDRLEEHDLKTFDQLDQLQMPKTLKKLDRAEAFVIKIMKNQDVIEKAQLLLELLKMESSMDVIDTEFQIWENLF